MNDKLMKGINEIITDNMFYDIDTEIMGVTNEGVQELIALCADEAIEAVNYTQACYIEKYTLIKSEIITEIERRMK